MNSSRPVLIIFVDALSFQVAKDLPAFPDLGPGGSSCVKITPGIGYSSNLHWQMFVGKGPDKAGFFTDWGIDEKLWRERKTKKRGLLSCLADTNPMVNTAARLALRGFAAIYDNIPFCERRFFVREGRYLFSCLRDTATLLGREMRVFKKETAPHTFKAASAAIEQSAPGDILVIIEELDRIGHLYGGSGSPYRTRARYILEESAGLVKKFIERNNDGIFALVSDHGMADVTTSLDIMNPVFGRFGLPGSVYLIYNDSVYLKVWCDNASLREDLFDFIKRHDGILSLDADMRAKYAINSQRFGDPVFVLKKGYVFSPNCFSLCIRGAPKGMHGYLEGDEDTSGILMTNLDLGKSADLPLTRLFDEFRIKSDREGP